MLLHTEIVCAAAQTKLHIQTSFVGDGELSRGEPVSRTEPFKPRGSPTVFPSDPYCWLHERLPILLYEFLTLRRIQGRNLNHRFSQIAYV